MLMINKGGNMKKSNVIKFISLFCSALMLISAFAGLSLAFNNNDSSYTIKQMDEVSIPEQQIQGEKLSESSQQEQYSPDDVVTYIVELESKPVLNTKGTICGISGGRALTNRGSNVREKLIDQQIEVVKEIEKFIGNIDINYQFTLATNAFSFDSEYKNYSILQNLEGVKSVSIAPEFYIPETEYDSDSFYTKMYSASEMVNLQPAWDLGYDGKGTLVAVIDSGLYVDHEAFAAAPSNPKINLDNIKTILENSELQAKKLMAEKNSPLEAEQVYFNEKIPYRFDYNGVDIDVGHGKYADSLDHGTHVTGIVAANPKKQMNDIEGVLCKGMAPEAQIAAMKVFSDHGGGAKWDIIMAALEDCIYIGADVVNMSLGSPAGFPELDEQYRSIYDTLDSYGVTIMAAAGNETSSAYGSTWGTNFPTTANADSGVVDSPSTYDESMSVAAIYNTHKYYTEYIKVGDKSMGYADSAFSIGKKEELLIKNVFGGQTLELVDVPGYGTEEDYANIDVTGKAVLIVRGNGTFTQKMTVAANHGAIAMIVRDSKNNIVPLTNMQIYEPVIPAVFIAYNDGLYIKECVENGNSSLYISDGSGAISQMSNGGIPASFSSWGPVCDLTIKPEISAPGGNIMSTVDPDLSGMGSDYASMSGTSMATPATSGAAAIVRQYVNEKYPDMGLQEKVEFINTILMSTAVPAKDENGVEYCVRKQGAGMIDVKSALCSPAVLTTTSNIRPKLELGSDSERTGVYTLSFAVRNLGSEALSYKIEPVMLTSGYEWIDQGSRATWVTTLNSTQLTDKMTFETNCKDNIVTVQPKSSENITVTMKLDSSAHELIKEIFPYGTYIEGYCYLRSVATDEGAVYPDLSICYLGYYGDWSEVPVVDDSFYYDKESEKLGMMAIDNTAGSKYKTTYYELGMNPYFENNENFSFLMDRCSISPNSDKYYDAVDIFYTGIMRNLSSFYYKIFDSETKEILWERVINTRTTKNLYDEKNSEIYPMGYAVNKITGWKAKNCEEGSTAIIRCGGVPYMDNFNEEKALQSYWEVSATLDITAPHIVDSWSEGSIVYVKVSDNHYAAYAGVFETAESETAFADYCICENERNAETVIAVDMTGKDKAYLLLGDYACNEAQFEIAKDSEGYEQVSYQKASAFEAGETYMIISDDSLVSGEASDHNDYAMTGTFAQPGDVRLQGSRVSVDDNGFITGERYSGIEWLYTENGCLTNKLTGENLDILSKEEQLWLGTSEESSAAWNYENNKLSHNNDSELKYVFYSDNIENASAAFDLTVDETAAANIRIYKKIESTKTPDATISLEARKTDDSEGSFIISMMLSPNSNAASGSVTVTYDSELVEYVGHEAGSVLVNGSVQVNSNDAGRLVTAFEIGGKDTNGGCIVNFTMKLKCEPSVITTYDVYCGELVSDGTKLSVATRGTAYSGETVEQPQKLDVKLITSVVNENSDRVINVKVNIENYLNYLVKGKLELKYDESVFDYVSSAIGDALNKYKADTANQNGTVSLDFNAIEGEDKITTNGNLLIVELKVKDEIKKNTETELKLLASDFIAVDEVQINSISCEGVKYTIKTDSVQPTPTPTAKPTPTPTAKPTPTPTAKPTTTPTAKPTSTPTAEPTPTPTAKPTSVPTAEPTAKPTAEPTVIPVPGETGSQITPVFAIVFAILGVAGLSYYFIRSKDSNI